MKNILIVDDEKKFVKYSPPILSMQDTTPWKLEQGERPLTSTVKQQWT